MTLTDPLPWFDKWTSGKLGAFLWMMFALLMISFYTSNLRAHMITIDYEEPLHTFEAIARLAGKVYLYSGAYQQRSKLN